MRFKALPVGLAAFLAIGCSDQTTAPTSLNEGAPAPNFKVDVVEYSYDYDLDWDPPYEDCRTGEHMQNHGVVLVHIRERTTPSGNTIVSGWVDYDAYGGVTLEGLSSGDIWTLMNGHNPFHEVIKDNGSYILSYGWNELYSSPDGRKLHINLKGHLKIEPDGTFKIDRESYKCH